MNLESVSPEERLLQLIRRKGRSKKEENQGVPKEKSAETSPPPTVSPRPSIRSFLGHLFEKKKTAAHPSHWMDEGKTISVFKKANLAMATGLGALLFLYLITVFWGKVRQENRFPKEESVRTLSQKEKKGEVSLPTEDSQKPYTYYAAEIEKRNIFGPSLVAENPASPGEPALKESIKDLNLLGIVSGKNPQAIIEDKKEGKTHFVNKGDSIGPLRVEEITEDRVILYYRGERLDLML